MKAIILASGIGKRLNPLTDKVPKPLIEVNGITLLERMIQSLTENGIEDIVITTGFLEEKIKEFMQNKYPGLKVTYVKNPIFDKTNYIYSLWLAKDAIGNDDIILLHGDLIYDPKLIKGIIQAGKSSALIRNSKEVPEKDFKARIDNGLIKEIGVKIFGANARFCVPLYKIQRNDIGKWLGKMEEFIKEGKTNNYAEDALNAITNEVKFYPVYYTEEPAMEIDDFEDLEKAKRIFKS